MFPDITADTYTVEASARHSKPSVSRMLATGGDRVGVPP